jgi:hypothetical protein
MKPTDTELLESLKAIAAKHGYAPEALLSLASDAASFNARAVIPNFGPFPERSDEAVIDAETLAVWPSWVAELVPPGSKWERLYWPDGSLTIRLINHRALVLAARHLTKDEAD